MAKRNKPSANPLEKLALEWGALENEMGDAAAKIRDLTDDVAWSQGQHESLASLHNEARALARAAELLLNDLEGPKKGG